MVTKLFRSVMPKADPPLAENFRFSGEARKTSKMP